MSKRQRKRAAAAAADPDGLERIVRVLAGADARKLSSLAFAGTVERAEEIAVTAGFPAEVGRTAFERQRARYLESKREDPLWERMRKQFEEARARNGARSPTQRRSPSRGTNTEKR